MRHVSSQEKCVPSLPSLIFQPCHVLSRHTPFAPFSPSPFSSRATVRCESPFFSERPPRRPAPFPLTYLISLVAGDGAQMPNNRCSNCSSYRLDCTYVEAAKVRLFLSLPPPSPSFRRPCLPTALSRTPFPMLSSLAEARSPQGVSDLRPPNCRVRSVST